MLVTNCIIRVGCAAALLTNDRRWWADCMMQLLYSLLTHHGSNDQAYRAAFQEEDEKGNTGISLTKDLIPVAGKNLNDHIKKLGPLVLPLSELMSYNYSKFMSALAGTKPKVPDFTTAFEHVCIHTGGKAVIEQVERVLRLSEEETEPAKMSLYRFGNTSSSLVWKIRIGRADRLWMLAFGTGFKVGSLVWKSLRDSSLDDDNPWRDCISGDFMVNDTYSCIFLHIYSCIFLHTLRFDAIVAEYTSYADASSIPGHYVLFLKLALNGSTPITPSVFEKSWLTVEESLNSVYRQGSASNKSIRPLEIRIVEQGTFDKLMDRAISQGFCDLEIRVGRLRK